MGLRCSGRFCRPRDSTPRARLDEHTVESSYHSPLLLRALGIGLRGAVRDKESRTCFVFVTSQDSRRSLFQPFTTRTGTNLRSGGMDGDPPDRSSIPVRGVLVALSSSRGALMAWCDCCATFEQHRPSHKPSSTSRPTGGVLGCGT